jgi:hypothetical protein
MMFNFTHTDKMILELYIKIGLLTHACNKSLELLNDPNASEFDAIKVINLLNISLKKV